MEREPQIGGSADQPSSPSTAMSIVWVLVAVLAHLALLDAAIETFWSGSPLRWWVAPGLLVFAALSAWLWRPGGGLLKRYGPATAAATPVMGFLAVLAVTAWLPGGQATGVRMFLQPTPRLLTAALALVVLLAGVVLFRAAGSLSATPRLVARVFFTTLALYALVAFGLALRDNIPFTSLFQGGALWQRLPRWLQGTFVGVAALLPVGILVQFLRIIGGLRRKQPIRALVNQATALVMAFVMALSGLMLPGLGATRPSLAGIPSTADRAAVAVSNAQIRRELIGQENPAVAWEGYSRAVENELKRPGADPSDVQARAAALGGDRQKIFEFVRDHITLEPYSGQLRGARGALAAGAGNALDRALLAQALLRAASVEARLVKGRLSSSQAEALLQDYLKTTAIQGPLAACAIKPAESFVATTARKMAAETGLREQGISASLRRAGAKADIFWWKTDEQRASQFAFVSDQLRRAGVKPGTDWAALTRTLQERLQEHYWLQVRGTDGGWSEFDTAFPDASRGAVFGSNPSVLSEVAGDSIHRFEFSLVYETSVDGALKQEVLLTRAFASGDALFAPIEFRIQPADSSLDMKRLLSMDGNAKLQALRKMVRFQGILREGSRIIGGRAFDLKGHTFDAESGALPGGSLGGAMGGLFGLGGEAPSAQFVDLQVVLRLTGPGREPLMQTRTLVRAGDIEAPTFAPPLLEWGFLVQPQWISPEFVGFQTLKFLMAIADAVTAPRGGSPAAPPPVPVQLLQLAVARQIATAGILAKQSDIKALIDKPMLTISTHRLAALRPDEGRVETQRTIDIVENSARYVAEAAKFQPAAFDAALRQGVADCVLEQTFLEEFTQTEAESGANLFRRAQLERRPILLTTSLDTAGLQAAGVTSADVEWIRSNESAAARLVVALTSDGRAAWWSVQPDGNAVLRVSGGRGQSATEKAELTLHSVLLYLCGWEAKGAWDNRGKKLSGKEYGEAYRVAFAAAVCSVASLGGIACLWLGLEVLSLALLGIDAGLYIG
ncbi:MAG TPA: transglutaminase domain-containing protein, partial [Vicinamibacterales bacterium]